MAFALLLSIIHVKSVEDGLPEIINIDELVPSKAKQIGKHEGKDMSIGIDESSAIKATPGISWNFEVKNRTGKKLYVTLQNGNNILLFRHEVAASQGFFYHTPGYLRLSGLNVGLPIIITLEIGKSDGKIQAYGIGVLGQDKTIFVTYESGKLRPQKGQESKTTSDLSLQNNIADAEIVRLPDTTAQKNLEEVLKKVLETTSRNRFVELERERLEKLKEEKEARERGERLQRIVGEHGIQEASEIEPWNEPITSIKPSKKEKKKQVVVEEPIISKKPKQPKQDKAELILRGKEEINPEELIEEQEPVLQKAQEMRENIPPETYEKIANEMYAERVAKLPPNLKKFFEEIPTASIQELQARLQILQTMRQYLSAEDKASVDLVISAIKGRILTGR